MWLALWAVACQADLLPGEAVLGDEVPAVILEGHETSGQLGAAVAVESEVVAVGIPGSSTVLAVDPEGHTLFRCEGMQGLGRRVWVQDGLVYAWSVEAGLWTCDDAGLVLVAELEGVHGVDRGPSGELVWARGVHDDVRLGGTGEVLRRVCRSELDCDVTLDGRVVGATTSAGAVGFWAERPCWGVVDASRPSWPGEVRCGDEGELVARGLEGEQLGVGLADGFATGVFDKWVVPARGRVVRLADGRAWSTDRAAEASALVVASDGLTTVVGVPGFARGEPNVGRAFLVSED